MFYQVLIETNEKVGKLKTNRKFYELDKVDLLEIEDEIITPYLKKESFQFDGYFLEHENITRLLVKQTQKSVKDYASIENANMPPNVFFVVSPQSIVHKDKYTQDITKKVLEDVKNKIGRQTQESEKVSTMEKLDKTRIFIVHGQDTLVKTEVARFIEKLKLIAIILHEQPSSGKTIIEKIESFSNVGFGIILYTPCDIGAKKGEEHNLQLRARQNVVFEHGYLIGKLGRKNVTALVKGKVETPNDISGVVYIDMDDRRAWETELAKELKSAGYAVDMNLLLA